MSTQSLPAPSRQRIIRTAMSQFNQFGYNATSIDDIQKAADVQRGSFYFHFRSKEALALAALDAFFASVASALEQGLARPESSALQSLFDVFDSIRRRTVEDNYRGGCLLGNFGQELSAESPRARRHILELFDLLIAKVAEFLALSQSRSEIPKTLDPKAAARLFISCFHGAILELKVYKDEAVYRESMGALRDLLTSGDASKTR